MSRVSKHHYIPAGRITWQIAVYIRLSRDDGNDESYSIKNQEELITGWIEKYFEGKYIIVKIYKDDGETGTDDNRPDFQQMIRAIEEKRVNCVVVKDLSRLTRNVMHQYYYLENCFLRHSVRFISLGLPALDSFLRPQDMQGIQIPFQGMMNESLARDTSFKVRQSFQTKRENGKFISGFAPFGYALNPEEKGSFIIDEEAAEAVRSIFKMYVQESLPKRRIANHLNALGVPSPSAYKFLKGSNYKNPHAKDPLKTHWTEKTITDILRNESYIGSMVQGKQEVLSYKVHDKIQKPREEWVVRPNKHAPIISKEQFAAAQTLLAQNVLSRSGEPAVHLFSGFLRCADCGGSMTRHKAYHYVYYKCRNYKDSYKESRVCSKHTVRYDLLESAILDAVKVQIDLVIDLAGIIERISKTPKERVGSLRLETMLKARMGELEVLRKESKDLYKGLIRGLITEEEYRDLREEYAQQVQEKEGAIEKIREDRGIITKGIGGEHSCFERFIKHRNIDVLDRSLLVELIESIQIHEGSAITVRFKYNDQFQLMVDYVESKAQERPAITQEIIA